MILCINGKSVGGMTEVEIQIELDVCGPELMLVVSRFDIREFDAACRFDRTLKSLAMDWNDIGAGASSTKNMTIFDNDESNRHSQGVNPQSTIQNKSCEISSDYANRNCQTVQLEDSWIESDTSQTDQPQNNLRSEEQPCGDEVADEIMKKPREQSSEQTVSSISLPTDVTRMEKQKPRQSGNEKIRINIQVDTRDTIKELEQRQQTSKPSFQQPRITPAEADKLGCKKCSRELRTGRKDMTCHDSDCPRKPPSNKIYSHHRASLSVSAATGCRKCIRELKTGKKDDHSHDMACPRKLRRGVADGGDEKEKQPCSGYNSDNDYRDIWNTKISNFKEHHPVTQASSDNSNSLKTSQNVVKRKRQSEVVDRYRKQLEELSDDSEDEADIDCKSGDKSSKIHFQKSKRNCKASLRPKNGDSIDTCGNIDDESLSTKSKDESDENPWLGCVCGKTHPHPIKVFWIQCEACEAWYNVAEECVGFNAKTAEGLDEWCCWACKPPVAGLEF